MDLGFSPAEECFRAQVRSVFASAELERVRREIEARGDRDPRPVYRLLGARGLLAPNWPLEYGGAGRTLVEAAVVAEELARSGIPDALHVISIQTAGNLILREGTDGQRGRYLPPLARGEECACVLFSEREAGSDLAAVATRATRRPDGSFELHGRKTYSLITALADYGICLARTAERRSRYDGLTLLIVPLRAEGVRVTLLPSLADDAFHDVEFDGVRVGVDAVIGNADKAWPVLMRALTLERTGLDYYAKARRWYELVWAGAVETGALEHESVLVELARLGARLDAARLLTYRILATLDEGEAPEDAAAVAKWYASELAAEIAGSAPRLGLLDAAHAEALEAAYRDAPGLRISGGTSEMMLETVARIRLAAPKKAES